MGSYLQKRSCGQEPSLLESPIEPYAVSRLDCHHDKVWLDPFGQIHKMLRNSAAYVHTSPQFCFRLHLVSEHMHA